MPEGHPPSLSIGPRLVDCPRAAVLALRGASGWRGILLTAGTRARARPRPSHSTRGCRQRAV